MAPRKAQKALKDLTREDVLASIAECDKLGTEAFLAAHGYRPSLRFVLKYRNRSYPSKAIVGVALGKTAAEFSGGQATVQRRLEALGFSMDVAERAAK
jgi:5-methylcytosine-specific restriction protein A